MLFPTLTIYLAPSSASAFLYLNDYYRIIINVYLSYLARSLIISLSSLLTLLDQVDHILPVLIIHIYVLVWIARVDTARRITPLHRLSLSTLCVAMSSRSPNQHHHQLPWRQHIIIQPTSPPPPSSLTSSAAAPDFGCEQVKKAKVSFPQFCLHPSSFLRYDPLGLPFSSLPQGHLSKSCLNRVLRPKYLSRERSACPTRQALRAERASAARIWALCAGAASQKEKSGEKWGSGASYTTIWGDGASDHLGQPSAKNPLTHWVRPQCFVWKWKFLACCQYLYFLGHYYSKRWHWNIAGLNMLQQNSFNKYRLA